VAATPMSAAPADDGPVAKLYFEVGSAELPADAGAVLEAVAGEARSTGLAVVISGFHDESGNAQQNQELAKQRAQAVQHALEANGVARERLMLMKPQSTSGGGDPREARRVELRVR
jgi:outer membrane protein OmpA-like peptidoglycan-associated protein